MVRWENLTTIELTITTAPSLAASAGMNSLVILSAEMTLLLKPACTASRSTLPRSAMGGITSALCTRASTRPNSSTEAAASRCASASDVMSNGTTSARRPSSLISAAISSSRVAVLAASTTSAPATAPRTAIWRPRSGPTPETTRTLSCRYISATPEHHHEDFSSPATTFLRPQPSSAHHPVRHCGLARSDPRSVFLGGDTRLIVVRQQLRKPRELHHIDPRPVHGAEFLGQALPADLHVAAGPPGELKPVRDTRIALGDHEPQHVVRVVAGLISGEAGLMVDVVERDVPAAAELDALIGRYLPASGGHCDDHRHLWAEVEVTDRGELGGQPARRPSRRRHRVDRLGQVEPVREGQKRPQPGQQYLACDAVPLGE